MSAKTHIPKKVTFTDSGTYLFGGNPLPVGPSSSLFQLPSTSCHSPARHFIQSHRMAAPLLLERVNSFLRHSPARHFTHTEWRPLFIHSHRMAAPPLLERVSSSPHTPSPSFAWYSSHPESCGSLSHSLRTLLSCHFPREVSP